MEPRRNLFTIGQASEYLGVSIDTLRRWEKKGRIEAFRSPGGHRYYERDDLDKLFGKKYVHYVDNNKPFDKKYIDEDKPLDESTVEESVHEARREVVEIAEIPPEPVADTPPPARTISIPEISPIQISKRAEPEPPQTTQVVPIEVLPPLISTQEDISIVDSTQSMVTRPPIQAPLLSTPEAKSFLMPQLTPLKEPARDEGTAPTQLKKKSESKETIQVIIIITVLILVILLAIILVVMMVKSSQSVLSPSP